MDQEVIDFLHKQQDVDIVTQLKRVADAFEAFLEIQKPMMELVKIQLDSLRAQMGGITPVIAMPSRRGN